MSNAKNNHGLENCSFLNEVKKYTERHISDLFEVRGFKTSMDPG